MRAVWSDTAPTGLTVVGNVDPSDTTLLTRHDELVREYVGLPHSAYERRGRAAAISYICQCPFGDRG